MLTHAHTHSYPQVVRGCDRCAATLQLAFPHFWSDLRQGHSFPQSQYLHKHSSGENSWSECTAGSQTVSFTQTGEKKLLNDQPDSLAPLCLCECWLKSILFGINTHERCQVMLSANRKTQHKTWEPALKTSFYIMQESCISNTNGPNLIFIFHKHLKYRESTENIPLTHSDTNKNDLFCAAEITAKIKYRHSGCCWWESAAQSFNCCMAVNNKGASTRKGKRMVNTVLKMNTAVYLGKLGGNKAARCAKKKSTKHGA